MAWDQCQNYVWKMAMILEPVDTFILICFQYVFGWAEFLLHEPAHGLATSLQTIIEMFNF